MPAIRTLQSLLAPVPVDRFVTETWEQLHLSIVRRDPGYYGTLFTCGDFDRCLHVARETQRDLLTMVPPQGSDGRARRVRGIDLDTRELYRLFADGWTLVINLLEKLWPPVAELAAALERALGASIFINAYLTPAQSQGFDVHFDPHDVFVLQVDGSKTWSIYERFYEFPLDKRDGRHYLREQVRLGESDKQRFLEELTLTTGDLLYLPRGFPHKAVATTDSSLHLTVGIFPLYWMDLLKAAVEAVGESEPALRRGLPPGFVTDPEVRAGMGQSFGELARLVARRLEEHFGPALHALTLKTVRDQQLPPDGHFRQLAQIETLTADSWLCCRDGLHVRVIASQGSAGIAFSDNVVRGPAGLAAAFEYIRDRRCFRLGDLPDMSDQSRIVLASRLIKEGLLRFADRADEEREAARDSTPR